MNLQNMLSLKNYKSESSLVMSDSLRPHELYSSWNSPGQNTGVGSLSLLQGNLPYPGAERGSPALQVASIPTELSLTVLGPCCCVSFSLFVASECCSLVVMQVFSLHCSGFSCCGEQLQGTWASEFAGYGLGVAVPGLQSTGSIVVAKPVGSSWIRDRSCVFCIVRWILYH